MSKVTKQSQIIDQLSTAEGASIEEMMKLTGWQKYTVHGCYLGSLKSWKALNCTQTSKMLTAVILSNLLTKRGPSQSTKNPVINNAIQANMNATRDMLEKAASLATEGCGYMDDSNYNVAIGSIIDLAGPLARRCQSAA